MTVFPLILNFYKDKMKLILICLIKFKILKICKNFRNCAALTELKIF